MGIQNYVPTNPMDTCNPPIPHSPVNYHAQWPQEWPQRDLLLWDVELATYISLGAYYYLSYY